MTGYTVLAGALIFFGLFIYLTWLGVSIKVANHEEEKQSKIKKPANIVYPSINYYPPVTK